VLAKTKRCVILSAKHERIRNPLKKKSGLPRTLLTLAVPKSCFCLEREQLLTTALPFARFFLHCSESNVTRNDERRVILSAWRERIRNPLKRKNGLPHTFGARNDGGDWNRIVTRLTVLERQNGVSF